MPMAANGVVKLLEELGELSKEIGELTQVLAKKLAYPDKEDHPDGKGDLNERIENETADVTAAIRFVTTELKLNQDRIAQRVSLKLGLYRQWHNKPTTQDPSGRGWDMYHATAFDEELTYHSDPPGREPKTFYGAEGLRKAAEYYENLNPEEL
jgi:hypothetical protein